MEEKTLDQSPTDDVLPREMDSGKGTLRLVRGASPQSSLTDLLWQLIHSKASVPGTPRALGHQDSWPPEPPGSKLVSPGGKLPLAQEVTQAPDGGV